MKRRVNVGEDFDVDRVEIIKAQTEIRREYTRSRLAETFGGSAALFLLVAGAIGMVVGQFGALGAVWDVVALPLGAVFGFYFKGRD